MARLLSKIGLSLLLGSHLVGAQAAGEPRIRPLAQEELSGDALALASKLRANFGLDTAEIPDAVATMLRHPDLYRAQVEYVTQRAKALVLAPRDLELIILRTAWLCRSDYIWAWHVDFGKKAGLTTEEIERLTHGSRAPQWSERDRALNRLVEELHETSTVSDETWAVIAKSFSDKQIIELLSIVGSYHEVAFVYNAIRVRPVSDKGLAAR